MKQISNKSLVFVLTAFALTLFASAHNPRASRTQNPLDRNVGNIHFEKVTSSFMFSYALTHAAIPGGIAEIGGCPNEPEPVYSFAFVDVSVRGVLETIAKRDRLDRWTLENGVVNLLPVEGVPALLDTRIAKFDSKDAATPNEAGVLLTELPEVERAARRLGLNNPFHIQLGLGVARKRGSLTPKPASLPSLHLNDVTFLDALNALVRTNGSGIWTYREWHCSTSNGYSVNFAD
jgi:hypothetical protein